MHSLLFILLVVAVSCQDPISVSSGVCATGNAIKFRMGSSQWPSQLQVVGAPCYCLSYSTSIPAWIGGSPNVVLGPCATAPQWSAQSVGNTYSATMAVTAPCGSTGWLSINGAGMTMSPGGNPSANMIFNVLNGTDAVISPTSTGANCILSASPVSASQCPLTSPTNPLLTLSRGFDSMSTLATQDYFTAGPICAIGAGGLQILCWFTGGIASPGDKRFVINVPRGLRRPAHFTGVWVEQNLFAILDTGQLVVVSLNGTSALYPNFADPPVKSAPAESAVLSLLTFPQPLLNVRRDMGRG